MASSCECLSKLITRDDVNVESRMVAFNQIDSVCRIRFRRNGAFDVVEFDVARLEHVLKYCLIESKCSFSINLNQSVSASGLAMELE